MLPDVRANARALQARISGCILQKEFLFEMIIMSMFCATVLLAAIYDFWKSSEMIFAPHRYCKLPLAHAHKHTMRHSKPRGEEIVILLLKRVEMRRREVRM